MARLKTKSLILYFLLPYATLHGMEKLKPPLNNAEKLLNAVKARDVQGVEDILSCTLLGFHAVSYAYAYALHSAKELTPNKTLRAKLFMQKAIEKVRAQRTIALDRLTAKYETILMLLLCDQTNDLSVLSYGIRNHIVQYMITYEYYKKGCKKEQIDETLIDQGTMYLACAKKIYPRVESLISDNSSNPTILAFYIGVFGHLDLLQDFAESYEENNANKIDWNFCDKFGKTLLHIHAQEGNLGMVDYLLKEGADYNRQTYHYEEADSDDDEEPQISLDKTALHCAAENHHVEIVKLLLRGGSNCDIVDYSGKLPLHYVAPGSNGNAKIFEMLILFGCNIDATVDDSKTLLWKAIEGKKFTVGEDSIAIKENFKATIEYLIDLGASPNQAFLSKFYFCKGLPLTYRDIENRKIVKKLISLGGNIDAIDDDATTLLYKAVDENNPVLVKYLLKLGANPAKGSLARYIYAKEEYVMDSPLDLAYRKACVYKTTLGSQDQKDSEEIWECLRKAHTKNLSS